MYRPHCEIFTYKLIELDTIVQTIPDLIHSMQIRSLWEMIRPIGITELLLWHLFYNIPIWSSCVYFYQSKNITFKIIQFLYMPQSIYITTRAKKLLLKLCRFCIGHNRFFIKQKSNVCTYGKDLFSKAKKLLLKIFSKHT